MHDSEACGVLRDSLTMTDSCLLLVERFGKGGITVRKIFGGGIIRHGFDWEAMKDTKLFRKGFLGGTTSFLPSASSFVVVMKCRRCSNPLQRKRRC